MAEPERRHADPARPAPRPRSLPSPAGHRRGRRAAPARAGGAPASAGSARRRGGPTRSSTSTTTSARSPCPRRARCASCSTWWRPSTRTRTTGPARCGCSTSSRGWTTGGGALVWKIHHTVADGTGAGRLAEGYLQPTRKLPTPPHGRPRRARRRRAGRRRRRGQRADVAPRRRAGHPQPRRPAPGRHRPASARGEIAMWGADPAARPDAAAGVVRSVQQVRSQLGGGGGPPGGGSPLWRNRSRHRRLDLLSLDLDGAIAAAKALRRLAQRPVRHRRHRRGDPLPRRPRSGAASHSARASW